jgi:hypothetical protein
MFATTIFAKLDLKLNKKLKKGGKMKLQYSKQLALILGMVAVTTVACGQKAKVKTITIVNGDTTISEQEIGDKEISEMEKNITMVINEDGEHSGKKTVTKKITINGDSDSENDAFAYAYDLGNDKDRDMEITTDENGSETKIIIKKGKDEKSESGEKKTVIKKSMTADKKEKEKMSINISVKNTIAKVDIETSGTEPVNITVLDENGKQVFYDSAKNAGKYSKEINLEKKGTYFMNIIHNKKLSSEKIEIK